MVEPGKGSPDPAPTDTVDYQERESHSPVSHPGRTMASLPRDSWTFPFRQQKEQNSMYLERWLQCGHPGWKERQWDVPGLSTGSHGMGARWDGEQGTGPALHPGLQVLSLVFCLNEAAALDMVHNLQPTAEPCQSPLPRLLRKECTRPSFPPCHLWLIPGESPPPWGMQGCCDPSRTHHGIPPPTTPLFK